MDEQIKVGGEVEAYCTSCRQLKWHVVVAVVDGRPARVECIGCHKHHNFRAAAPGTAKPSASRPKAARARQAVPPPAPPVNDLEERLRSGEAGARAYSPREAFAVDEVVRHPSFGVGLVVALPSAQKMEVAFRDGRKLLVHQRAAEAAAPALTRPSRKAEDDERAVRAVTDAPDRSR